MLGHSGKDDFFACSGIKGNFLLIAMNTAQSHMSPAIPGNVTEIELAVIRADSGEGLLDNCQTAISSKVGYVKALDMIVAGETGIYLLADVAAGSILYVKQALNYTIGQRSLAIILLKIDDSIAGTQPEILWVDIEACPRPAMYPPSAIVAYYPSGIEEYGPPDFLLLAHVNETEKSGIVFYSFGTITCAATETSPQSKNPFVTDQGCVDSNAVRCFAASTDYSAQCAVGSYLAGEFVCTASACPSRFYQQGKTCRSCHYSCLTCDGPMEYHCISCDSTAARSYDVSTRRCNCNPTSKFSSNGGCVANCSSGSMGYTGTRMICRAVCPSYTFHYIGYSTAASVELLKMYVVGYTAGKTSLLEFSASSSGCLALPGPKDATAVPEQFAVSFWIYRAAGWTAASRVILWGFNTFRIAVVTTSLGIDTVQLLLSSSSGAIGLSTSSINGGGLVVGWNYIAASVRRTSAGIDTILYTSTDVDLPNLADRSTASNVFSYPAYTNTVLIGCDGSYDSPSRAVSQLPGPPYSAYVRELVYLKHYHELMSLHANKNRAYAPGLEIYAQLLSYWRLDDFQPSSTGEYITKDGSQSGLIAIVSALGNPTKSASSRASFSDTMWDNAGECVDLFSVGQFPTVSLNLKGFATESLQYKMNMYSPQARQDLLTSEDTVRFYRNGCGTGSLVQTFAVSLGADAAVHLEGGKLPLSVYGTYLDVCYYSTILSVPVKLGQVYFPLIPEHVSPAHGSSDGQSTSTLVFSLFGGDQSANDLLMMLSLETSVQSRTADAFLVDESLATYQDYTMHRSAGSDATMTYSISTADLDTGTYTLLWRPAFLSQKCAGGLIEYKNLFVLWTIQDTPHVRFDTLDDGTAKNGVVFKAEFFELNLVGPGQADGDQVLFCLNGCHYSNRKGSPYTRANGKYPPVWFGEEYGVSNLLTTKSDNRLFICWRPAARARVTAPGEDTWNMVTEDSAAASRGYITVDSISDNANLPEIASISPPSTDRVLREGQNIWFVLSKCTTKLTKPSADDSGVAGRVQIVHLTYTSGDLSSYNTNVVWEQLFTGQANAGDVGFTVGKLRGDPSTCNFTITELSPSSLVPGDTYRLIIYSKSFKSPVTNDYFLGNIDAGTAQLQYEFVYQEARYHWTKRLLPPTIATIDIPGSNLGTVAVSGLGFKRLLGVNVTLTATCTGQNTTASYRVLSLDESPSSIRLTDLSLASCTGELSATIQLIKLHDYDSQPIWSCTSDTVELGTLGCYFSCETCNGTGKYDCLSCSNSTDYQYLYKGECSNRCGTERPYAYQNTDLSEVYYHCLSACPDGYFADPLTNECVACDSQCRTCTSAAIMSCTSCQSVAISPGDDWTEDSKWYADKFYFDHMCVVTCPVITNDISIYHEDLVSVDNMTHICVLNKPPTGAHPISVSIQPLPYRSRVNLQESMKIRALVSDPTGGLTGISWQAHPAEDIYAAGFNVSDQRTFASYDALDSLVVAINMNSLNYKTNNDAKHIIVKVRTIDSMGIAFTELFGNLVADFKQSTFALSPTSLVTMSSFNITVGGAEDPDGTETTLKFHVTLETLSLSVNTSSLSSSQLSSVTLSTDLTSRKMTLYSGKSLSTTGAAVLLSNIHIPPLIDGPQTVADGITTNVVTCQISVVGEDSYQGSSLYTVEVNVTDPYTSVQRTAVLSRLYVDSATATEHKNFSWDLALEIANTFTTIVPAPKTYVLSYTGCARDSQCAHGKCIVSAGLGSCYCDSGYLGQSCQWTEGELNMAQNLAEAVVGFLNFTLVAPVEGKLDLSLDEFNVDDIGTLVQLADALSGILADPELLGSDFMSSVVLLCDYLTRISMHAALRMEEDDKVCILKGIDAAVKYLLRHMRNAIYLYYLLSNKREVSNEYEAAYAETREKMSILVIRVRNSLYRFLNLISVAEFSGDSAFRKKFDTFEVFLKAETKDSLFEDMGTDLAVQLPSGTGLVRVPVSLANDLAGKVTSGAEFVIRIVNWFQSPYVFSPSSPEVYTSVESVAILNNNASEISANFTEPIVLFLPATNWTKSFPNDRLKCKLLDTSARVNVTRRSPTRIVDTSLGPLDDHSAFVDQVQYHSAPAVLPDFIDDNGVSAYGGMLTGEDYTEYVPCAVYRSAEVAAVAGRKRSLEREDKVHSFYHYFDPLDYWKASLGFYTCIGVAGLFALTYLLAFVLDQQLLPKLERVIQVNRRDYNLNESEINDVTKTATMGVPTLTKLQSHSRSRYADDCTNLDKSRHDSEHDKRPGSADSVGPKKTSSEQKSVPDVTLEKVEVEPNMELTVDKMRNELGKNRRTDTGVATSQVPTTQDQLAMRTNIGGDAQQDEDERGFAKVRAVDIRNKEKVDDKMNDIFSPERTEEREREQFTLKNLILQGNLLTNLIMWTNTTLSRTTRCLTLFLNLYLQMFWVATFIAATASPLDHPDDFKRVTDMMWDKAWLPFVAPGFSMILLYLFAALFKVSDDRVLLTRTFDQYRRLQYLFLRA